MPDLPQQYQEHVLNESTVCSNCFGRLRREAIQPTKSAWRDDEVYSERCRWQTSIEDVPGPVVHEASTLFCECGASSAFDRVWSWRDVGPDRFRLLLRQLVRTVEALDFSIARQRMVAVALQGYRDQVTEQDGVRVRVESDIDAALADGLAAGLRSTPSTASRSTV